MTLAHFNLFLLESARRAVVRMELTCDRDERERTNILEAIAELERLIKTPPRCVEIKLPACEGQS